MNSGLLYKIVLLIGLGASCSTLVLSIYFSKRVILGGLGVSWVLLALFLNIFTVVAVLFYAIEVFRTFRSEDKKHSSRTEQDKQQR